MELLVLAFLVLTIVSSICGAIAYALGGASSLRDIALLCLVCVVATEAALIAISSLKGTDQASATQAGMSGLMVLMMLAVGGMIALWLTGLVQQQVSLIRWSPILFFVSLVLVAASAIRTIRRSPATAKRPEVNS